MMLGLSLSEIHAIAVHVPIVLLPLGVVVDLAGRIQFLSKHIGNSGLFLILLGWLGSGAAVISGWQVQGNVSGAPAAANILFWHRLNGLVIVGLFALVLLVRLGTLYQLHRVSLTAERNPSVVKMSAPMLVNVSVMLAVAGLILVIIQGYLGGALVYQYGIL